ncbi:MAG: DNA mismatch repair protein MutS [Chloroflexota bacterium]|nr:DNA mismatch repair protein MutS [Chloroflexota bacterium]
MVTPVRQQYLDIKAAYPDALVFFRMGDFYETFDDDAVVSSRALDITLTSRGMGKALKVPMAGVPAHALEPYLVKLIQSGHKVAICEQLSDPASSSGLLERGVVRLVTPGTVLETGLLEQNTNNYLVSVFRNGREAGLAFVDASTGEFAATQISTDKIELELLRLNPAEILIPKGADDDKLFNSEELNNSKYNATEIDSFAFNENSSKQSLLSHFRIFTLESLGLGNKPLAVRAAGSILYYLSQTYKSAIPRLSMLSVYSVADFMVLDDQTRRNLELFVGGRHQDSKVSLLNTLDITETVMGSRLMRRWVGQPLLSLTELNRRLDAVETFFDESNLRNTVRRILAQIPDIERILVRLQTGSVLPRELISLKTGLEACVLLQEHFAGYRLIGDLDNTTKINDGDNTTMRGVKWVPSLFPSVDHLVSLIEASINNEPSSKIGEGSVIKEGFSYELDEIRRNAGDAREFIAGLEVKERERTGIKGLKVGYNQVFGYYLEISKSSVLEVPDNYIRRQTLANAERYLIPELKEYESLVLNARERIDELERDIFRRICVQMVEGSSIISELCAIVSKMDVFATWAEVAVNQRYVRPALNQDGVIEIKDGRHPIVEMVNPVGFFVPNDLRLSSDDTKIWVVTGPNMAGKSTFIRQVALITLMAQIGSFVPASEATIGLVDRIFTRVGLQDDLATGHSTFMVEMVETAAILNQATRDSLVILDEIGRGTSTYDGLSIARSVIEHIHNHPQLGCKTLFATHYHELTDVASVLPGVRNYSVAVTEEAGEVFFLHRIIPGGADRSYGVHVAQLAGLPPSVVSRAWEILKDLESDVVSRKNSSQILMDNESGLQIPLFEQHPKIIDQVLELDIANLTPLEAINKLYELQQMANEK